MSLTIIMYLIDIYGNIISVLSLLLLISMTILFIHYVIKGITEEKWIKSKRLEKLLVIFVLINIIILTFLPTKKTVYVYFGEKIIKEKLQTEMSKNVIKIITYKIKEELNKNWFHKYTDNNR